MPITTSLAQAQAGPARSSLGGEGDSLGDTLKGFTVSALESFPELFGIKPSEPTQEFRARHPVLGIGSELAGGFIPYVGAAKLLEAAPLTAGLIKGAEALGGESAIARGALKFGAETGLTEAGRLAISATPLPETVFGRPRDESLPEMTGGALLNTVLGAGLGGVVGGLGAKLAAGAKLQDMHPGLALDQPVMTRINALDELLAAAPDTGISPETVTRLSRERDKLTRLNLGDLAPQYLPTGEAMAKVNQAGTPLRWTDLGKNFRPLEGEKPNKKGSFMTTNFLNGIDKPQNNKVMETAKPIYDPLNTKGLKSRDEVEQFFGDLGVTENEFSANAQNATIVKVKEGTGTLPAPEEPRVFSGIGGLPGERLLSSAPEFGRGKTPSAENKAKSIQNHFTKKAFSYVGDNLYMAKEQGTGFYVFAKKLEGTIEAPGPGDKWAVWRTPKPAVFNPRAATFSDALANSGYFPKEAELQMANEPLWDRAVGFKQKNAGKIAELTEKRTPVGKIGGLLREATEKIGTYVSPTAPGATRNFKLNYSIQLINDMKAAVNDRVDTLMRGGREFDPNKSAARQTFELNPPTTDGLQDAMKLLTQGDRDDIQAVLESEVPYDKVKDMYHLPDVNGKPLLSEAAFNHLTAKQLMSDAFDARLRQIAKYTQSNDVISAISQFQTRMGHYMVTRDMPHPYRMRLVDEGGNLVGMPSGQDQASAARFAQDLIEKEGKRGRALFMDGLVDENQLTPQQIRGMTAAVRKPGFLKSRGSLLGYELQRGPLTHEKFVKITEDNIKRRENFIRDVVVNEHLGPILNSLSRTSPEDAKFLQQRLNLLKGDEGEFAKATNKMFDTALHAVGFPGKDTASAIVRETQKTLSLFQFQFGNLAQPLQNMINALQTFVPEAAFITHASEGLMAKHYVSAPLVGNSGHVVGQVGFLSPWKMLRNGLDTMVMPFGRMPEDLQALHKQMVREGVITGQFAEEQFGMTGAILAQPREAFRDTHSFVKFLSSLTQVMMTKSEEFNRTLGVHMAYQAAKLRGIPAENMGLFAREFIGKTAYGYSVGDRATIFTTPLGSLAGTFKNWMFHYMASMVKYATGGREALPALFWQTAMTGVLGGAAATPFIIPVSNGISQLLTNKTAMQNLYDVAGGNGIGEHVADGVMYGLPGALGVGMSSIVNSPGANPERDAQMMFSFAVWDRMKGLSGATKDALQTWNTTGESPFEDAIVRGELMRALAPRTLYRGMASLQDQSIHSLATGYKVTGNLGLVDRVLYTAGFNPVALDKSYEAFNAIKDNQAAKKAAMQEFGQTLAQAWDEGDDRAASSVFTRALAMGLDTSSILRSAQARTKRATETQLEYTASPEDREDYGFAFDNGTE